MTPYENSPQTFAIRFSVKQRFRIRRYLKGPALGFLDNRAQTFVRQAECPRNVCARLLRVPNIRFLELATNLQYLLPLETDGEGFRRIET